MKEPAGPAPTRHIIAEIVHLNDYRFLRSTLIRKPDTTELMQI